MPTWSDNTVLPGVDYVYRVKATNAAGDSAYSAEASVSTPEAITATLLDDAVSAGSGGAWDFRITFTAAAGVDVSTAKVDTLVRVTGPSGFNQLAKYLSIDTDSDGSPRTLTYRLQPPRGNWSEEDNGAYTVTIVDGVAADLNAYTLDSWSATLTVAITDGTPTLGTLIVKGSAGGPAPWNLVASIDEDTSDPAGKWIDGRFQWQFRKSDGSWLDAADRLSESDLITGGTRYLDTDQQGAAAAYRFKSAGTYTVRCRFINAAGDASAWVESDAITVAAQSTRPKLYVGGAGASDANDGSAPDQVKATLSGAIAAVTQDHTEIIVADGATIADGTPTNITRPLYIHRSGAGAKPTLSITTNDGIGLLRLNANNILIEGLSVAGAGSGGAYNSNRFVSKSSGAVENVALADLDFGSLLTSISEIAEGATIDGFAWYNCLAPQQTQRYVYWGGNGHNRLVLTGCNFSGGSSAEHCVRAMWRNSGRYFVVSNSTLDHKSSGKNALRCVVYRQAWVIGNVLKDGKVELGNIDVDHNVYSAYQVRRNRILFTTSSNIDMVIFWGALNGCNFANNFFWRSTGNSNAQLNHQTTVNFEHSFGIRVLNNTLRSDGSSNSSGGMLSVSRSGGRLVNAFQFKNNLLCGTANYSGSNGTTLQAVMQAGEAAWAFAGNVQQDWTGADTQKTNIDIPTLTVKSLTQHRAYSWVDDLDMARETNTVNTTTLKPDGTTVLTAAAPLVGMEIDYPGAVRNPAASNWPAGAWGGPDAPANPAASVTSVSQLHVSWDAVSGASGYQVYYGTRPGLDAATEVDAASNSLDLSGLTKDTPYYLAVTAVGTQGTSAPSATISQTPAGTVVSYRVSELDPGTTYYFRISAANAAGSSDPSATATATTQTVAPGIPTALGFNESGSTTPEAGGTAWVIYFTAADNYASLFRVQTSPNNATWSELGTVGDGATAPAPTSKAFELPAVSQLWARVRAENSAGVSAWSTPVAWWTGPAATEVVLTGPALAALGVDNAYTLSFPEGTGTRTSLTFSLSIVLAPTLTLSPETLTLSPAQLTGTFTVRFYEPGSGSLAVDASSALPGAAPLELTAAEAASGFELAVVPEKVEKGHPITLSVQTLPYGSVLIGESVTLSLSAGGFAGSLADAGLLFAEGDNQQSTTFTPSAAGTITFAGTPDRLSTPASVTAKSFAGPQASGLALTGPATAASGSTQTYSITLTPTGSVAWSTDTITLSVSGGGSLSAASLPVAEGQSSLSFTYTGTAGAHTLSLASSGLGTDTLAVSFAADLAVSLSLAYVTNSLIRLSWTIGGGSGDLTANLHRSTSAGFAPAAGNLIAADAASPYDDAAGLQHGVLYRYKLQVSDALGQSAVSNELAVGLAYDGSGGGAGGVTQPGSCWPWSDRARRRWPWW